MAETRLAGAALLEAAFARARDQNRAALMPYMMGGFPDSKTAHAVAESYVLAGADIVELGVPFSDPLADGPVIHAAATTALENGATYDSVLGIAADLTPSLPVVLMIYANMVISHDPVGFAADLERNGIAGVIIPDLPPEEASETRQALSERGLALIPLVAPTTPPARRRAICEAAQGFVYVVSDTRTTGERDSLPAGLGELVAAVRADAAVPAAVGFGIGTPQQAGEVGAMADGVIVGSRLVRAVDQADSATAAGAAVSEFLLAAREAMSVSRAA